MRRYGQWAGNPRGDPEDPARCIEEVRPATREYWMHGRQYNRKRGQGPDGLYCKQHAAFVEAEVLAAKKAHEASR